MAPSSRTLLSGLLLLSHHAYIAASEAVQNQTITVQLYGPTSLPPISAAEVLGYNQGTTTLKLLCDEDSTAAGCGQQLMNGYTIASNVQNVQARLDGEYTAVEYCTVTAAAATCNDYQSEQEAIFPAYSPTATSYNYTTSYTTTYVQAEVTTLTLSVIGGANLLPSNPTALPSGLETLSSNPSSSSTSSAMSSAHQGAPASSTSSKPMQTASSGAVPKKRVDQIGAVAAVFFVAFCVV